MPRTQRYKQLQYYRCQCGALLPRKYVCDDPVCKLVRKILDTFPGATETTGDEQLWERPRRW